MSKAYARTIPLFLILALSLPLTAADLQVGKVTYTSTSWGSQTARFSITNLSPDFKFVVAKIDISFIAEGLTPSRTFKSSFFVEPSGVSERKIPFQIPGNYGQGIIRMGLYDVVDTLDELFESEKFFTNVDTITYKMPAALRGVPDAQLNAPVLVGKSELFDNEFNRILIYLLDQGKTIPEIASATATDTASVRQVLNTLLRRKYLTMEGSRYRPAFAVINTAAVNHLKPLIDRTVDDLYKRVVALMPGYDALLKSLAAQNKLTSDQNNIMDGGSILYHKYVALLSLFLWDRLGCQFVNDGVKFDIFEGSDPCRADMGKYMYLVSGLNSLSGRALYYYSSDNEGARFYCSAVEAKLQCTALSQPSPELPTYYQWQFDPTMPPMFFNYNPEKVEPALVYLDKGTAGASNALKDEITKYYTGAKEYSIPGARYWTWNLVVTTLMSRLERNKLMEKEGTGLYLLNRMTD